MIYKLDTKKDVNRMCEYYCQDCCQNVSDYGNHNVNHWLVKNSSISKLDEIKKLLNKYGSDPNYEDTDCLKEINEIVKR
jgi:hypothetical protein